MTEISAINTLMVYTVDYLADRMIIAITDETQVGLLRSGKLQSDPTVKKLNILIHQGGPTWEDCILPKDYIIQGDAFTMGGEVLWLRRFRLEFELFFTGETVRDTAREKAQVIFSRARKLLKDMPIPSAGRDSFGEAAIMVLPSRISTSEDGGPGNFIWRGDLYFEFLTETL